MVVPRLSTFTLFLQYCLVLVILLASFRDPETGSRGKKETVSAYSRLYKTHLNIHWLQCYLDCLE